MKRHSRKSAKKRRIAIISLILAVFIFTSFVTAGYAYFSDNLVANISLQTSAAPMKITAVERSGVPTIPSSIGYETCSNFNSSKQNWVVSAMNEQARWWLVGISHYYMFVAYKIPLDSTSITPQNWSASIPNANLVRPASVGASNEYTRVDGVYGEVIIWGGLGDYTTDDAPNVTLNGLSSLNSATTETQDGTNFTSAAALPISIEITNPNEADIEITSYSATINSTESNLISIPGLPNTPITVEANSSADIVATIFPKTDGTFELGTYVITLTDENSYDYTLTIEVG